VHDAHDVIVQLCQRLRRQLITYPLLASLVRSGPPLHHNEFIFTERLLTELRRIGLAPRNAALAYHAIIELTVGSAALDADVAAMSPPQRRDTYRSWQQTYGNLDPENFPTSCELSSHLYVGTADDRFSYALNALLLGLA
jgi:TetR/AcrR family transcriptional regulator, tetracycline repressor protein